MKIWDCYPAYLNQNQLIAEHRELHGLMQLIETGGGEQSNMDPHVANWLQAPQALAWRHALLVEEMRLHQVDHKSPMDYDRKTTVWPVISKEMSLSMQYDQLKALSHDARLVIPTETETLIRQNAFSIMARDPGLYKYLQSESHHGRLALPELFREVTLVVRKPVSKEVYERVIATMWRYCQKAPEAFTFSSSHDRPSRRIRAIQYLAGKYRWPELWQSTALTDLACCALTD